MAKRIGVWIDHVRARVVTLADGREPAVDTLESDVEPRHRAAPREAPTAKRVEHRREHELKRFYDRVTAAVTGADELLLLGPGQPKAELARHLEQQRGAPPPVVTSDNRLTDGQLVARVRSLFDDQPRRWIREQAAVSHVPQPLNRHGTRGLRAGLPPNPDPEARVSPEDLPATGR